MDAQTAIRLQLGDQIVQIAALTEQKERAEAERDHFRALVEQQAADAAGEGAKAAAAG